MEILQLSTCLSWSSHDHQWLNSAGMGRNGVLPPVSGVPPPEVAVPSPKVVVSPPGKWHSVIIRTVATRCQILRLKCIKYYFGWGSAPDPAGAGGDYSACPEPLAGRGLLLRGWKGGKGKERRGLRKGREGKKGRRNVAFHHLLLNNLTTDDHYVTACAGNVPSTCAVYLHRSSHLKQQQGCCGTSRWHW